VIEADLPWDLIDELLDNALDEDRAYEDVTTTALVDPDLCGKGRLIARENGVVSGLPVARRLSLRFSDALHFTMDVEDGSHVSAGTRIGTLTGKVSDILSLERTLLNFLQRLSGVATLTAQFVHKVEGTDARILDTRKTTPGWRRLEKYAVACGGGQNHRMSLGDQVLIKENHLKAVNRTGDTNGDAPDSYLGKAVRRTRGQAPAGMIIETEVENLEELKAAVKAGADIVLLDNMSPEQIEQAIAIAQNTAPDSQRPLLEASGGIGLENVADYARTGVDRISIGALTHSAPALDISLDLIF